MSPIKGITFILLLVLLTGLAMAQPNSPRKSGRAGMCPAADLAAIRKQWSEWTAAYAAHDLAKTMEILDRDVIFSFQGAPDQNYSDLEKGYKDEFSEPDNKRVWVPQFEEFECSGNLGFVRSTWVLKQNDGTGAAKELAKNRGVDLFRRDANGRWKIFRSLNYPFAAPSK
jgi:ketosteroid isomerase-like protein